MTNYPNTLKSNNKKIKPFEMFGIRDKMEAKFI